MTSDFNSIDIISLTNIYEQNKVKFFSDNEDILNIINVFLEKDIHEEAFFIVNLEKIIHQYYKWKKYLPNIVPYYAVKCNPNPVIIQILHHLGCYFDCASKNEMSIVNDLIKDSSKILFANPIKTSDHIRFARANDVDLMTFDCEEELHKIRLFHPYSNLILRIAVDDKKSIINFSDKFGARLNEIKKLIDLCLVLHLNLVGVSFHVGTGCYDSNQYNKAICDCRQVFNYCLEKNIKLKYVDIGGGFCGVDNNEINFENIANIINNSIQENFEDYINEINFIAEPGRFFVANSHTLVVNIIGKKMRYNENNEKEFTYYINDGIYGSFNCVYFEKTIPNILPFNERNEKTYNTKIFGPTCDSIDLIVNNTRLPELVIGEWCYIENFGAYTSALASNFNGFQKTQIYYIRTCLNNDE